MTRALLLGLLGLAAVPALAAPPLSLDTAGSVWDGVYSSPDGSFHLRGPTLLLPGARIEDSVSTDGVVEVWFGDDLCREFRLRRTPLETPPASEADLKRLAGERIVPEWQNRTRRRPTGRCRVSGSSATLR